MLEILFQDKHICVVNKPSGYVVHKTRGAKGFPILLQELRDQLGQYVYPMHRIDRGTSGLLCFALEQEVVADFQLSLQQSETLKIYNALCLGKFKDTKGYFDRPLTGENGIKKEALTHYTVLKEYSDYSLLELSIKTGRKHQIRRHLSFEAHHIIGDVNHGKGWLNRKFRDEFDFHRLFLHCKKLQFNHPILKTPVTVECPLPSELEDLLLKLDL